MNLKEFYTKYKSDINESVFNKVKKISKSNIEDDIDSEVFSIKDTKELREHIIEFMNSRRDWFKPLKLSAIRNLLKTQSDEIDFDKIYYLDLRNELAESKCIPQMCKFFKYFDDEIFLMSLNYGISAFDDVKDFTTITVSIYAKKEDSGYREYSADVPVIGEIHLNTKVFDEYSSHKPFWDSDCCYASTNREVFDICLDVINKMYKDIGGFLSKCPQNKQFVRDMYWNGRFNANKDKLNNQEIFTRPLLKWLKV